MRFDARPLKLGPDSKNRARFGKDSSAPPDCSQILPSSYASRITAVELNSAISSSLLDLFLTTQPTIAFIEDTGFRLKFEAAGRRFDQLEDQSQVRRSQSPAARTLTIRL